MNDLRRLNEKVLDKEKKNVYHGLVVLNKIKCDDGAMLYLAVSESRRQV